MGGFTVSFLLKIYTLKNEPPLRNEDTSKINMLMAIKCKYAQK